MTTSVAETNGLAYQRRPAAAGAPTLLLIHGLGDSRQTWTEAFADASIREYGLCAVDLPGFGDSPPARPFSLEDCVGRLCGLIEAELAAPLVVVGHSMGGAIATLLAAQHRDVRAAVVIEANMTTAPPDSIAAAAAAALAAGAFSDWFADFRRTIEAEVDDPSMRRYRGSLDRVDAQSFGEAASDLYTHSLDDGNGRRWLALDLPRLYIAGRGVWRVTFDFLERHDLEVLRFPDAGHAVMVDEPIAFYAALGRWIDAHLGRG